jgi:peptidoglycan/xylan/chitin deacetylase (PgdA/CDA1 family)
MTLRIVFPDSRREEKRWVCNVVLGEWLGMDCEVDFDGGEHTRICADGKVLALPDAFFARADEDWFGRASMPAEHLLQWPPSESGLDATLVRPVVPVMFGRPGFTKQAADEAELHLDVFGAAFFMLARYEEVVCRQRDSHGRFPASASLAYRAGFLDRPIVDEYVDILYAAMRRLWPRIERRRRRFQMAVTCDVDHPYHPSARSVARLIKRALGETIRRRSPFATLRSHFASRRGDWRNDPYYHTVDWMMDVNERAGNVVAFYFIPEITDAAIDDTCTLTDPAVIDMIERIAGRGHEIGIHPGYRTYRSRHLIRSGLNSLQQLLHCRGIAQQVAGGRQHYLRWSMQTPGEWEAAGLRYDSTLGYAEHAGFRCGTCREYPMFDLCAGKALRLRQRPLICMEISVIRHMGRGVSEAALATIVRLKEITRQFGGSFTLLWHNSGFEIDGAREMYCNIIDGNAA